MLASINSAEQASEECSMKAINVCPATTWNLFPYPVEARLRWFVAGLEELVSQGLDVGQQVAVYDRGALLGLLH